MAPSCMAPKRTTKCGRIGHEQGNFIFFAHPFAIKVAYFVHFPVKFCIGVAASTFRADQKVLSLYFWHLEERSFRTVVLSCSGGIETEEKTLAYHNNSFNLPP